MSQAKDQARKEAAEAESGLYTKTYEVQQMQQQINTAKVCALLLLDLGALELQTLDLNGLQAAVRELEVGVEQLLAALHDAKRNWQHEMYADCVVCTPLQTSPCYFHSGWHCLSLQGMLH